GSACDQGSFNLAVAIDPQNENIVYQGAVSLFRSGDGGASWATVSQFHPDCHALVFDQLGNLYIGNDGALYRRTPAPQLFTLNNNLNITQFYAGVALHPTNADIVLGGAQDNGSDQRSAPGLTWRVAVGGDGMFQAIEGTDGDPDNVWYSSQPNLAIRKTINNGATTFAVTTGITDRATGSAFVAPYIMDPTNSNVLIAGTRFVWRTENGAASWTQNSPQLTNGTLRALAIAPTNPNMYCAGASSGRLSRTTDAGANWLIVFDGPDLNFRGVTDVAVHPLDANIVYATYGGFGPGHIYRSGSGGAVGSWQDITSNLPNVPT